MLFEIYHITEYSYSADVFFEPHFLRLRPKFAPHLSIVNYDLRIEPKPAGFSELVDSENNHLLHCWFEGMHRKMRISVKTQVEIAKYNPLNFLVSPPKYLEIPFSYDEQSAQLLRPYLATGSLSLPMQHFLNEVLQKSNAQTLPFLTDLITEIHEQFVLETREFGEPYDPEFTYQQKMGSCRDLSWMLIHMLRHLGIASRFVSGYFYLDAENPEFELHAWVEVYLPGAGWIGYDPTHGLITASYHIPLAASAFFNNTMPVSGSIRGNATSKLENELRISIIS